MTESKLHLYNTKGRDLQPITSDNEEISIYCCGPTVYRDAHVGNLRTFLLADLVARTLRFEGWSTKVVQNITDVGHMNDDVTVGDSAQEDKILQEAAQKKIDPFELARKYESKFYADLKRLNIEPADFYPRASETINLIIETIEKLIESGNAYKSESGSIYFDASTFESYGAISGNKLESLKPGHRYEYSDDGEKRFHADWALWKAANSRTEMIWPSPWGSGFPGWHIECTAMSLSLLNEQIDIHIGGIDLRFPHHENERAQSNSIVDGEAVNLWLHGEHLLFEGRKMSKSSGNVLLVEDIVSQGLDPIAIRLSLLENRYRSQMDLTWRGLRAANSTLIRWRRLMSEWGQSGVNDPDSIFLKAIFNDLDTPRAIIRLRAIEKDLTISNSQKRSYFLAADRILGLDLLQEVQIKELSPSQSALLAERNVARLAKNWDESDRLRDELFKESIVIKDSVDGQSWSWLN